jgi:chromosome segregation and condensation protein ScpB
MIMSSLKDIVLFRSDRLPKTLAKDEALLSLVKERLSHIENILTEEQMKILIYIVSAKEPVTQNQIAQTLGKAPTNISNYYFRPLLENSIIEMKKEAGKLKYWGLTKKYLPLTKVMQSHENIQKQLDIKTKQLQLI